MYEKLLIEAIMIVLVSEAGAICQFWDTSDISLRGKINTLPSFPLPWQETAVVLSAASLRSWWAGLAHAVKKGI